jgi:hypothetical protein
LNVNGSRKENEERTAVGATFSPEPERNGTSDLTPPTELMSVRVGVVVLDKQPTYGGVPATTPRPTMETAYESKDPTGELDVEQMPVRAHFSDCRSSAFKKRLGLIGEGMTRSDIMDHGNGDELVPAPPPTNTNMGPKIQRRDPLVFMLLSYIFLVGIGVLRSRWVRWGELVNLLDSFRKSTDPVPGSPSLQF